jgi:hypothetical protein
MQNAACFTSSESITIDFSETQVIMLPKLIHDIRPIKPPAGLWDERALLNQAAFRWLFMLRELGFALPGFDHLDFLIILTPGAPADIFPQVASGESSSMQREVHCQVRSIPDSPDEILKFINDCIYACLRLVCRQDSKDLEILTRTHDKLQASGESFQIVRKVVRNRAFEVSLSIRPCGLYPSGGEMIAAILQCGESAKIYSAVMFEYCSYWDIKALLGKVSINGDVLEIVGSKEWVRKQPQLPSRILVSLSQTLAINNGAISFLSDVSLIKKALKDYDLSW